MNMEDQVLADRIDRDGWTTCPRCFTRVQGAHTCSGKSPHPGTIEYERMVDAGERAALRSEMDAGNQYAEEDATAKLRQQVETNPTATEFTISRSAGRFLLNHIDRLRVAEREMVRLKNADFARRSLISRSTLEKLTVGQLEKIAEDNCPTCAKPLSAAAEDRDRKESIVLKDG